MNSRKVAALSCGTLCSGWLLKFFDQRVFRMATTLPNDILSVALSARGVLELGLPNNLDARASLHALRSLPAFEWPSDLQSFHTEIDATRMEFDGEDVEVVTTGTVAEAAAGDDVGLRAEMVDSLASVASEVLSAEGKLPGSASCDPDLRERPPEAGDRRQEVPEESQRKLNISQSGST